MKFWQAITWAETDQLLEIAKFAEEVGFYGLMGADHALFPEVMAANYPYSTTGLPPQTAESEYPDCWVTIAAMAAVTTSLKFTTGVYVLPLRNPIELAKATSTLAIISQGRFILGAGAGWMKEEFDIYGVEFNNRGKRFDESLQVLRKLWQGGMVEFHGDFFDFPKIQLSPTSQYDIPIYIGGSNTLALNRAATYGDGWIGAGNDPKDVPAIIDQLHKLRVAAARDHLPFETIIGLKAKADLNLFKSMRGTGMTSGVNYPFAYVLGQKSSLDDKKRMMEKFYNEVIRANDWT